LIFDHAGNLYGTAAGGAEGWGVVYELTPNPDGSWTESVLTAPTSVRSIGLLMWLQKQKRAESLRL
jgi:hypothetical protein